MREQIEILCNMITYCSKDFSPEQYRWIHYIPVEPWSFMTLMTLMTPHDPYRVQVQGSMVGCMAPWLHRVELIKR